MPILLLVLGFVALAYQAVAILASLAFIERARLRLAKPMAAHTPPVSILKPVYGLDDAFEAAIESHANLDYPEFEVLFGVHSLDDPAVPAIRSLIEAHPGASIRLIHSCRQTPNAKVGTLIDLAAAAKHAVLLVNDADITVPRDYLRRVAAQLADPGGGMVTCLYRASAGSLPGQFEALGIATDFIPSTLVAPFVGVNEFGLGSTLCFRREDLDSMGGFAVLQDYIADDYQLAKRITALGRRCELSEVVVETSLGRPAWRDVWRHQARWARTIYCSRPGGYYGLPTTHAGLWAVVNLAAGNLGIAVALWLGRVTMGVTAGFVVLRHWPALLAAPLIPLWDLWAFAVWLAALVKRTVYWRGRRITLQRDGRLSVTLPSTAE